MVKRWYGIKPRWSKGITPLLGWTDYLGFDGPSILCYACKEKG
jgi:hypothetical protein